MKNLKKNQFLLIIIANFLCITLISCRASSSIRIINSTNERLEIIFYQIDAIDSLYSLKKGYGDSIIYAPDSIKREIRRKNNFSLGSKIENKFYFDEMFAPNKDNIESFTNVNDDSIKGIRSFILFPGSEVVITHSFNAEVCNKDDLICPYIGRLIIKHQNKLLIDVEKEEVGKVFKRKTKQGEEIFYLEIKKKDLEASSKTPKTE